jgi:hypothetical protein
MNTDNLLVRVGGVAMLGVFGVNVYIGLYDTNLSLLSPLHWDLNWLIAVVDLTAAAILLVKPGSTAWGSLAGIAWPVVYVANLLVDVETRLCLGNPASACSPTVSDAYQYLIMGSASEEWVLWPYTIRLAIALAVLVLVLTLFSIYLRKARKSSPATGAK